MTTEAFVLLPCGVAARVRVVRGGTGVVCTRWLRLATLVISVLPPFFFLVAFLLLL